MSLRTAPAAQSSLSNRQRLIPCDCEDNEALQLKVTAVIPVNPREDKILQIWHRFGE
jgi:hypothetical protein